MVVSTSSLRLCVNLKPAERGGSGWVDCEVLLVLLLQKETMKSHLFAATSTYVNRGATKTQDRKTSHFRTIFATCAHCARSLQARLILLHITNIRFCGERRADRLAVDRDENPFPISGSHESALGSHELVPEP